LQGRWHAAGSVCCSRQASLSGSLPMTTRGARAWCNTSTMKDLFEKVSHISSLILDAGGVLTDGSLELLSRVRGTIDGSNDGNG